MVRKHVVLLWFDDLDMADIKQDLRFSGILAPISDLRINITDESVKFFISHIDMDANTFLTPEIYRIQYNHFKLRSTMDF